MYSSQLVIIQQNFYFRNFRSTEQTLSHVSLSINIALVSCQTKILSGGRFSGSAEFDSNMLTCGIVRMSRICVIFALVWHW